MTAAEKAVEDAAEQTTDRSNAIAKINHDLPICLGEIGCLISVCQTCAYQAW